MLSLYLYLTIHLPDRVGRAWASRDERGQATAEYALILLAAMAIGAALLSWISRSNPIGRIFDLVLTKLLGGLRK